MDPRNEQIVAHTDIFPSDPAKLLTDLKSGLDALRSLISTIDAREQRLALETFRSVLPQFDEPSKIGKQ